MKNNTSDTAVLLTVVFCVLGIAVLGLITRAITIAPDLWVVSHAQWIAAISTLVAALVSALALYYLRKTLIETRRIGQAQVRAYVAVDNIAVRWKADDQAARKHVVGDFVVTWKNFGQSPARLAKTATQIRLIPIEGINSQISDFVSFGSNLGFGGISIPVGDCINCGFGPNDEKWMSIQETDKWLNGESLLVIYSRVNYLDVFGVERITETCQIAHHFDGQGGDKGAVRFSDYPFHNRES